MDSTMNRSDDEPQQEGICPETNAQLYSDTHTQDDSGQKTNMTASADEINYQLESMSANEADNKRVKTFTEKGQQYSFEKLTETYSDLEYLSLYLIDMIRDKVDVEIIRRKYTEWMSVYEQYLQKHDLHYDRIIEKNKQEYLSIFHERQLKTQRLKSSIEDYFTAVAEQQNKHTTSVRSKSSSHRTSSSQKSWSSNISSKRLKEEQKKAELLAKKEALKKKQEIELAKVALRFQEEELELNTDVAVAEARTQVLDKYEQLEHEHSDRGKRSLKELEERVSRSRSHYNIDDSTSLNPNADTFIPSTSVPNFPYPYFSSTHAPAPLYTRMTSLSAPTPSFSCFPSTSAPVSSPACIPSTSAATGISQFPVTNTTSVNSNVPVLQNQPVHEVPLNQNTQIAIQSVVQHLRKPIPEIKKFGGNPMEYRRFIRQFQTKVVMNCDSNDEKMNYLEQLTYGEAHKVVTSLSHLSGERAYPAAMKLLEERYGDEQVVASAFVKKALEWPVIRAGDSRALDEYSLFLVECETANEDEGVGACSLNFSENIKRLVGKLPLYLHDRWRNTVLRIKENKRIAKFADFVGFVKSEAKKANDPVYGNTAISEAQKNTTSTKDPKRIYSSSRTSSATNVTCEVTEVKNTSTHVNRKCSYCGVDTHDLKSCRRILTLNLQERYAYLKSNALCFGCLRKGHMTKQCRNRISCSVCGKRHPTMLHDDSRANSKSTELQKPITASQQSGEQSSTISQRNSEQSSPEVSNVCTSHYPDTNCQVGADEAACAMAIIPVKVKLKNKPHTIETYAFFDSGSTVSFCTEKIMRELNGCGKKTNMTFKTMGNPFECSTYAFDGLQVCDMSMQYTVDMPRVYTKETMPVTKEHIPTAEDIRKWQHLAGIKVQDITSDIGLMIGNNVPDAYTPFEVATGPSGSPHGTRTRLGWIIWNVIRDNTLADVHINHVQIQSRTQADAELHELVTRSINLDFPERLIDDCREHSKEDKNFLEQVNQSVSFENGHYCIALPFRDQNVKLPCNATQGLQRLKGLKNKLSKDSKLKNDYINFMETLFEKGYAESVPEKDLDRNDGRVWYIPHHGVYHPKKPEKIRVVFDCSASYMGVSLNHQLLQGPDLSNNLLGVLLRFREEKVAILGDVEAMFYQVKVPESDRDCLRFFWWPGGDLNKEPLVYRMVVHLFGATSSPSCCNFALKHAAQQHSHLFEPEVVDTITRNMYVDDCLASAVSEEKALSLIQNTTALCAKGGFRLTKWTSSSPHVIESIPEEERAKEVKQWNFDNEYPIERALGVYWFIENDKLGFQITLKQQPPTRRGILSTVSSVYDPLGIASPFVLLAKSLLQDLCKRNVGWDNEIDSTDLKKWNDWLTQLPNLERISIDRSYKPCDFGRVSSCQLHVFSDASDLGLGMVLYLRLVDENGMIHCSFLLGKSRVAPLKTMTIPRMELTAAARAVKLAKLVSQELSYTINRTYFWTDSTSVLRYIANQNIRFHTFVANRLALIQEATKVEQWSHIRTDLNPADFASRGISIRKLLQKPQWLNGPDFIWKPESEWPQSVVVESISPEDSEVKRVVSTSNNLQTSNSGDVMDRLLTYPSTWIKLKRITGWLLLAMDNLKNAVQRTKSIEETVRASESDKQVCDQKIEETVRKERQSRLSSKSKVENSVFLTVDVLKRAERCLIRYVQQSHFSEELENIRSGVSCKRSSKLFKFNPFLDNDVLRVGGRLERAELKFDTKHPILLPKDSTVSKLIIEGLHCSLGHLGRNFIMAALRQEYWILGAHAIIKGIVSKCVTCRKYQGPHGQQKMANLPSERLKADEPPFTHVGMDFFGPFEIKRGRSVVKRYGVIFTCMTIRAVHLEMASSLDTDSCIDAIRRFISRRGVPKSIRSDNGTNLVGAEREMREEIQRWNKDKMNSYMLQKNIHWNFNPPAASHFGGVWERVIRTVRKVLFSVMCEQIVRLDDEGLQTLLCEVEAILNGRPLSEASDDTNDLTVLTPNHLLLLKPGECLPPGTFDKKDSYVKRRWRQVQYLANLFWRRWTKEYLPLLIKRQKWIKNTRNMKVGDIVMIVDNTPRNMWIMGRILDVVRDKNGDVRSAKVRTPSTVLARPISKLCLILESDVD